MLEKVPARIVGHTRNILDGVLSQKMSSSMLGTHLYIPVEDDVLWLIEDRDS